MQSKELNEDIKPGEIKENDLPESEQGALAEIKDCEETNCEVMVPQVEIKEVDEKCCFTRENSQSLQSKKFDEAIQSLDLGPDEIRVVNDLGEIKQEETAESRDENCVETETVTVLPETETKILDEEINQGKIFFKYFMYLLMCSVIIMFTIYFYEKFFKSSN